MFVNRCQTVCKTFRKHFENRIGTVLPLIFPIHIPIDKISVSFVYVHWMKEVGVSILHLYVLKAVNLVIQALLFAVLCIR